ncbi:hypothetical protein HAV15_010273 [Penicillium sp. str. |nr:hypothetical protein HAV15_010273 [Penicillium sp. str. \
MCLPVTVRTSDSGRCSELREMLATLFLKRKLDTTTPTNAGERKPVDGECPICFNDFKPKQKTTWCQDCRSNFHQGCLEKWRAAIQTSDNDVRCLYCKLPWKGDEPETPRPTPKAVEPEQRHSKMKYPNVGDN